MSKTIGVLLVIFTALALIITNFNALVYSQDFYKNEFEALNVSVENPENINNMVLGYYAGRNGLDADVFNEREITHLQDVKGVLKFLLYLNYFLVFLVIIILAFYYKEEKLPKAMMYSGLSAFGLILVFGLLSYFYFDFIFELMHKMLFSPGSWLFDFHSELLTRLYPVELFFDFAVKFTINVIISSLVLIGIGLIIKKLKIAD